MGGGSGSQSSTSTYSPPPEVAAAYKQLLSNAQPLFTAPYQPYTAGKATTAADTVPLTVAPQTPNQVAAGQNISNLAGYYQPYANAATDMLQQGSQPIQLQQFNNQSVGQYMSPYLQNVMGSTIANINETNAQQQQQVLGNTISKGAYGGDRGGIAQAELARQQNLANNATLANIANTGYNSALGQYNAMNQLGMNAQSLSNQYAQQGASGLANLGTMGQNAALQQAQAQYGIGSGQQQQRQAELSTAYQNYLNQIAYPYQQAQFEGGLISGVASGMGGTTSSTATPAQPGGMNQVIGGLGALGSLGSLFGGGGGAAGAGGLFSGLGTGMGAMMGGIGEGLGAAGAGLLGIFSDERLKENIHPVGKTFDGQNIYKYNYKGDPATHIGLLAQEVEHKHPSAVGHSEGYKTVNYDKATEKAEHRGHFAAGGDVQKQQGLLGVSPIAGMTASSYLPTGQMAMANPKIPQTQAPTGKNPNEISKDQLSDAVKGIRTLMGKTDPNAKPDAKPATAGVAPVAANTPPAPTAGMAPPPPVEPVPPPVEPIMPIQQEASGGRIHHYGVGGVADSATTAGASSNATATSATAQKPNSFDALKASQQRYTQALPNAGVVPVANAGTSSNTGNVAMLSNPGSAYSNYNSLANSGRASFADLQNAYDLYLRAQAPAEAITQVQMGSGTTTKPADPEPVADPGGGGGSDGGGGGGGSGDGGGTSSGSEGGLAAAGGRIHAHHFGTGGGIVNYIGMPTKKSLQEGAESVVGSGTSGGDPTLASIASQDFLPEQAARGGVIGREHHAGPDETNGQSNVVGNGQLSADEVIAQALPRIKQLESGGKNIPNASGSAAFGPYQFMPNTFAGTAQRHPEAGVDPNDHKNPEAQERLAPFHARDLSEAYKKANLPFDNNALRMGWAFGEQGGPAFMKGAAADPNTPSTSLAGQAAIRANPSWFFNPDGSTKTAAQTISFLTGGMNGPTSRASAPQGQSQGQEQPRQGPMQLNQTATKEGLSGMLGISMTDNQRLAAFNAFARMAGTPGKFGMGLAAAADTYSKTLMEANKQQREGYTAESEAKLRAEQAADKRITQRGLTTQARSPADDSGKFTIENQIIKPGSTVTFGGQGQPNAAGATGGPNTGQAGGTNAPEAPMSPQQEKEISLLGPRLVDDKSNKFSVLEKLGQQAIETNAMNDTEARAAYQKEFANAQTAAKAANAARGDLASTVKAVSELPSGGLTGFGPGSESRLALARTINAGLRTFGEEGFDENNITQQQIANKVATLAANEQGGSAAAKWLSNYANAFPNPEQTEQAAKTLTAKLLVANTQHLDYARVAQAYGDKSQKMGYDINNAMEKVNPSQLYVAAQNDIAKLMINNSKINPSTNKMWNPVSALAAGEITPQEFDNFAIKNGSKISNLSRFVLGQ
jgi:hypothetical protein